MADLSQVLCCRRTFHVCRLSHRPHFLQVPFTYHNILNCYRPLDDMEVWFQRFEAEERRQRMIAQAMKEQKDSIKTVEGEGAAMAEGQGNDQAVA